MRALRARLRASATRRRRPATSTARRWGPVERPRPRRRRRRCARGRRRGGAPAPGHGRGSPTPPPAPRGDPRPPARRPPPRRPPRGAVAVVAVRGGGGADAVRGGGCARPERAARRASARTCSRPSARPAPRRSCCPTTRDTVAGRPSRPPRWPPSAADVRSSGPAPPSRDSPRSPSSTRAGAATTDLVAMAAAAAAPGRLGHGRRRRGADTAAGRAGPATSSASSAARSSIIGTDVGGRRAGSWTMLLGGGGETGHPRPRRTTHRTGRSARWSAAARGARPTSRSRSYAGGQPVRTCSCRGGVSRGAPVDVARAPAVGERTAKLLAEARARPSATCCGTTRGATSSRSSSPPAPSCARATTPSSWPAWSRRHPPDAPGEGRCCKARDQRRHGEPTSRSSRPAATATSSPGSAGAVRRQGRVLQRRAAAHPPRYEMLEGGDARRAVVDSYAGELIPIYPAIPRRHVGHLLTAVRHGSCDARRVPTTRCRPRSGGGRGCWAAAPRCAWCTARPTARRSHARAAPTALRRGARRCRPCSPSAAPRTSALPPRRRRPPRPRRAAARPSTRGCRSS